MSRNDSGGRVTTPTAATPDLSPSHRTRSQGTAVAPDLHAFAAGIHLPTLSAALHRLRYDHSLVVAAKAGLELGDERRGIAAELKQVSLDVRGDDDRWALLARRHIQLGAPATLAGTTRLPVRCDLCHGRLSGPDGISA